MKVYLDTNVLVAAFATRGLCADLLHAVLAEHQLVIGEAALAETQRVLRQKIRLSAAVVAEVDSFLRQEATVVTDAKPLTIKIRDKDDLVILAEALAGEADILVTGDGDLLDIADRAPLRIVTPRGLWELLRSNPDKK
ncbi:MAG: putative toxin-antitoxin system toxin component, PIN family [Gemmatimonadota bacterium]